MQRTKTATRGPGRPPKSQDPLLTRERILTAALAYIDAHGVESLSVRKLAGELGVSPNSLYWYVRSKADLVDGVLGIAFGDMVVPSPRGDSWVARMEELCTWFRARILEHPNLVTATGFQEAGPLGFIPLAAAIGEVLNEAGFADQDLTEALLLIQYHVIGFVILEVARTRHGVQTVSDESIFKRTDADLETPHDEVARFLRHFRAIDLDHAFERSLRAVLTGLDAQRDGGTPR